MKFYSQQKEDEFVFKNFINQKNKDCVFLENKIWWNPNYFRKNLMWG